MGKAALPTLAGRTVKVVFAYIETSKAKVVRLSHLEYAIWEVDAQGWVSQDAIQKSILAKINGDGSLASTRAEGLSPCDMTSLLRRLGIMQQHP